VNLLTVHVLGLPQHVFIFVEDDTLANSVALRPAHEKVLAVGVSEEFGLEFRAIFVVAVVHDFSPDALPVELA